MIHITNKHFMVFILTIVILSVTRLSPSLYEISAAPTAGVTELISVSSNGEQGNGTSGFPYISADGRYVAFVSEASNLVEGDTNGKLDSFIHDRLSGSIELVSVSSIGEQGNDGSTVLSMSADGRYVAFYSTASNLVSGDTNGTFDIFVRDRQSGITERVSVSSTGEQGNDGSVFMSISANGRYVAFSSKATNLVSGDTNGKHDIFIRDRQSGITERVSVSSTGEQGNDSSAHPFISADGRFVAFGSGASNLVSGDTNGIFDTFVHDRQSGVTELVSVSSSGEQANQSSYQNSISADGRFVAFHSDATSLVSGDTNETVDVFVRDRQSGITERVSVSSTGEQANDYNSYNLPPFISGDGRYVAFRSNATNLVSGDTNGAWDIFVRDRQSGITERVSVSSSGEQGNGFSEWPSISSDGRYVTFYSEASNLVSGDVNGVFDVFVRDRSGKEPWLIMYYLAGDNSLYESQKWLLELIKKYDNQPAFNIAVMFDGLADNDSRFYYIADNTVFSVKDELDSGNPSTLIEFINWSIGMFPVDHTALVINDHASLAGIANDVSQGNSLIKINEVGNALQEVYNQWGKIDILFLEGCLLGTIEAGYQLKDYIDYLIASEHLIWLPTSPDYLNTIESSTSPEELAIGIATNYHQKKSYGPHTISVAKMSSLPNLATKISTFADLFKSKMNGLGDAFIRLQILSSVQRFSSNFPTCTINLNDESIDLYDFARLVKEKTNDNDLKNAAKGVMDSIEDDPNQSNRYIIKNLINSGIVPKDAGECPGKKWELGNSHGVSIFFSKPESKRSWYNGNTFAFAIGTNWELNTTLGSDYHTDIIQWGPMLVEYVKVVYPDAGDDPNPPPIVPPLTLDFFYTIFLPVAINK